MPDAALNTAPDDPHRALVLDDRAGIVDLIELTLNHGQFVVRAARSLAQAEAIVAAWHPDFAVIDMDHDDSAALLGQPGRLALPPPERHAHPGPDEARRPAHQAARLRPRRG